MESLSRPAEVGLCDLPIGANLLSFQILSSKKPTDVGFSIFLEK